MEDSRMRVLTIGSTPPPVHGSSVMTERFISALEERRHEVVVVQRRLSLDIKEVGRLQPAKVVRACRFWLTLLRLLARDRGFHGCVHFLTCSPSSFLVDVVTTKILARYRLPIIHYIHGIGFRNLAARSPRFESLVGSTLGRAAAVVILGESGRDDISPWVAAEKVRIVPNAIPPISAPEVKVERRRSETTRFLYLSTLDPEKGAHSFVDAALILGSRWPDIEFVLAGQPASTGTLEDLVAKVGASGGRTRVEFVGPVYGEEKARLLRSVDVFVFPTRYKHENFPLVNLEAMSAGLPVISTTQGCVRDQVDDGITGILVPPGDIHALVQAMEELHRNSALRTRLGENGRRKFQKEYSLAVYGANWERVLDEVSARRDSATRDLE